MTPRKRPFRVDSKQTTSLVKAARSAAIRARRDSKSQGLTVMFIKNGHIYSESANGSVTRVGDIRRSNTPSHDEISLAKGTVLRARL